MVGRGAGRTAEAIEAEALQAWAGAISERVDAVHPELAWELGPGTQSKHVLVVTAAGEGEAYGRPLLAMAQVPLRPMIAPHLDTHVEVTLPFPDDGESGLPDQGPLAALRDLEDHLSTRLGDSGRVLAHETSAGSRRLHVYVDSTTPAVEQVRTALSAWPGTPPRVAVTPDPAWAAVAHLRG